MTRRGSLIYYLAAWALGCFFMVLVLWSWALAGVSRHDLFRVGAEGFLGMIFYGYVCGAPTVLLYAFLLRRIMIALKCKTPLHWAFVGAILATLLVAALGVVGRSLAGVRSADHEALLFPLLGAEVVLQAGWWLTIPAGFATGYYLGRIQRAFAPQPETTPSLSA
jgi:hypothetical protein